MKYEVEKKFVYNGYNCAVVKLGMDFDKPWRCGYVELKDNSLTEEEAEYLIDCHGGITFYGEREPLGLGLSIGFDCNHIELADTLESCTLDYCINQCKKIADQLDHLDKDELGPCDDYKNMTNEEAADLLEADLKDYERSGMYPADIAALKLAIKALRGR